MIHKNKLRSAVIILASLGPAIANAEVPNTFNAGEPAVAARINENFSDLDQRIIDLGQVAVDQSNGVQVDVALDCSADANAFLNTPINSHTTYILTGMCNGPIWIDDRRSITIQGDGSGSKDDGIILQAGLTDHPYGALGVWDSKAIVIDNLALSASNYVSEDYPFGSNVAALSIGHQSRLSASNIDFIGGDYSVNAYTQAYVRLGEGISATGFNRGGLSAYSGALIRSHNDITVTGIVGTSTNDYSPALGAARNGIIEIRNGGTFTAGSTSHTIDDNGFTIYPAAVWVSDNASLQVSSGSNPTVFNGAVESGYSAMIRINGNTSIHGVLGVYHSGVIYMNDTTQDSGEVWVGDGGYLRSESSTITTADTDGSDGSIELYRNGRARINNSTLNLGGFNIWVGNYSVLNLRGSTTLGTDGVDCGGDGRSVSINNSVTLGTVSCWSP